MTIGTYGETFAMNVSFATKKRQTNRRICIPSRSCLPQMEDTAVAFNHTLVPAARRVLSPPGRNQNITTLTKKPWIIDIINYLAFNQFIYWRGSFWLINQPIHQLGSFANTNYQQTSRHRIESSSMSHLHQSLIRRRNTSKSPEHL